MFKWFNNKRIMVFSVIITLFFSFIFTPLVEAKPQGSSNTPPVIAQGDNGSMTINENTTGTMSLAATDSNNDSMTWKVSTLPINGTALIGPPSIDLGTSTVTVSYTPKLNITGTDSFQVTVSDGKRGTDKITITVTINPVQTANINYVALGDSIATGTIYPGKTITTYVTYFYEYLKSINPQANVTKTSFATDGDRTDELYTKLGLPEGTAGDSALISAVGNANVITISIGGNNLMQAAKDSTALGGYNFNKINTAVADQGLKDFQAQWIPIIEKIKALNSQAKIIVNTLYNPYNESDSTLHNIADSYLTRDGQGLNDLIINNASNKGYFVANVYQNFNDYYKNNMGAITYFYPTNFWGKLTRNPHPNAAGQNIITNLCKAAYESSIQP